MVEWFKALVLKTSDVKASVGSNPTLSVFNFVTMKEVHLFTTAICEFENTSPDYEEYQKLIDLEYEKYRSVNDRVLDLCPNTKTFIKNSIQQFVDTHIDNENLIVTQSWIHKSDNVTSLFGHYHPNSILSGVYYLDADENTVGTTFYKGSTNTTTDHPIINVNWKNKSIYSYVTHTISAKKNTLYLFPSEIIHNVSGGKVKQPRHVLSFNTWFDGPFGSSSKLTRVP